MGIKRRDFLKTAGIAGLGILAGTREGFSSFATKEKHQLKGSSFHLTDQHQLNYPAHTERFPSLTTDGNGTVWLAVLERPVPGHNIGVYRLKNGKREQVANLAPENLTGIGVPSIAPLRQGCVVVFPVEQGNQWHIAFKFIGNKSGNSSEVPFIKNQSGINIAPSVAVIGEEAWVVWESNAGGTRCIYAARCSSEKTEEIIRLSASGYNSYNPSIVALSNDNLFAVWDSQRENTCDIWGACYQSGKWQKEKRLTSDPRIERHPSVASNGEEIWMTWEAQSYGKIKLNYINEQRIVAARLKNGKLHAPKEFFKKVSQKKMVHAKTPNHSNFLMRPRIAFDSHGTLWLTARQSIHQNAGWLPLIWKYQRNKWSEPFVLMNQQGRWHPVPLTVQNDKILTAVQYDDLPKTWDDTRGVYRTWKSGINLVEIPCIATLYTQHLSIQSVLTTEPLKMPSTRFNLKKKRNLVSAEFPRQKTEYQGKQLTLFFGDFHDHTSVSVCQRAGNPPAKDLYANLRDIEKLDFCAITDHGYNFDPPQWQMNREQTRKNHDSGQFITFLGEEWTSSNNSSSGGYGHHNLIFLDPRYSEFFDAFDGNISPQDLWHKLKGVEYISIPHQLADWKHKGKGNPPKDWAFHDEKNMPVAEIYQTRGSYEYMGCPGQAPHAMNISGHYLQDAWRKGIVVGVIASPDHGGGYGKIGVWGENLTREDIFRAVRQRHTFGTSGPKMGLLFKAGEAIMGDKVKLSDNPSFDFRVKAVAREKIREVVIFRNNQIVLRKKPQKKEIDLKWKDENRPPKDWLWYYTRIQTTEDELAWSSPIWFIV